jgi:hypothetical protein
VKRVYKGNNNVFWSSLISLSLSLFLLFFLLLLSKRGIYIQFGTPPPWSGHTIISAILILIATISISRMIKVRELKYFVIALGLVIVIIISLAFLLINPPGETKYTRITSPDNKTKYLIVETGAGRLYRLSDSGMYMTFVTPIRTDDGYLPFADNAYEIEWLSSNHFILHYAFNRDSRYKDYREITVHLE